MILYLCLLLTCVFSGICYINFDLTDASVSLLLPIITFIVAIITQATYYFSQVEDIEKIEEEKDDKKVFEEKADSLLAEFTSLLGERYPEFEKEIFEKMTPEGVTAYMIKYPELKSSETISKLVEHINSLKSRIYKCDLNINELRKRIRVRKRTIKIWVFPILPKD